MGRGREEEDKNLTWVRIWSLSSPRVAFSPVSGSTAESISASAFLPLLFFAPLLLFPSAASGEEEEETSTQKQKSSLFLSVSLSLSFNNNDNQQVTTFLAWAAEPEHDDRKLMGAKWILVMTLVWATALYYKRWKWAPIKSRRIVVDALH